MGKYIKKPKIAGDVAVVMEVSSSPSPIGVRTRAKTLALQKSDSYLQLRSRRLQKLVVAPPSTKKSDASAAALRFTDQIVEPSFGENILEVDDTRDRSTRESTPCTLIRDLNAIDTPGSTTRQRMSTFTNQRIHELIQINIPTAYEMDEFFAYAEKQQQTLFMDKYNFDIVNDVPLPGRYEWVQVHR